MTDFSDQSTWQICRQHERSPHRAGTQPASADGLQQQPSQGQRHRPPAQHGASSTGTARHQAAPGRSAGNRQHQGDGPHQQPGQGQRRRPPAQHGTRRCLAATPETDSTRAMARTSSQAKGSGAGRSVGNGLRIPSGHGHRNQAELLTWADSCWSSRSIVWNSRIAFGDVNM